MKPSEALYNQFGGKKLVTAEEMKAAGFFQKLSVKTILDYERRGKLHIRAHRLYPGDAPMFDVEDIAKLLEKK